MPGCRQMVQNVRKWPGKNEKSINTKGKLNLLGPTCHLRYSHLWFWINGLDHGNIIMTSKMGDTVPTSNGQEAALLQRIAAQHRGSFEQLFSCYHPRVFKFVFRLTRSYSAADELANDVLLTVWQSAGQFRAESKVSTWIFGIAYRKSLRYLRKRKLKVFSVLEQDALADDMDSNVERQDWVQQAIQKLPAKQKLTVMLVYYLGLSCEETAAITGSPVSTVKTRMFHARRKLKTHLADSAMPKTAIEEVENE